jgi:hypothetical protein
MESLLDMDPALEMKLDSFLEMNSAAELVEMKSESFLAMNSESVPESAEMNSDSRPEIDSS